MLSTIFEFFYNQFVSWTIGFINLVTSPILETFKKYMPSLDNIIFYANEVFTQYFLTGAHFVKMAFCNFLGINHNVFTFVALCFLLRILIWFGLRGIRLVLNVISIIRIGKSGGAND